jgi:hypothetical protein
MLLIGAGDFQTENVVRECWLPAPVVAIARQAHLLVRLVPR